MGSHRLNNLFLSGNLPKLFFCSVATKQTLTHAHVHTYSHTHLHTDTCTHTHTYTEKIHLHRKTYFHHTVKAGPVRTVTLDHNGSHTDTGTTMCVCVCVRVFACVSVLCARVPGILAIITVTHIHTHTNLHPTSPCQHTHCSVSGRGYFLLRFQKP